MALLSEVPLPARAGRRLRGGTPLLLDTLRAAMSSLRGALADLDVDLVPGADCMAVASELASIEKMCAAARARAAARAAASGAPRRAGFADPADWLARETGTSRGEAQAAFDTTAAAADLPRLDDALRAGELSMAQAAEIAKAAGAVDDPDRRTEVEAELIDVARHHSLRALKDKARARRHEGIEPEELHRRQRNARYLRHWRDELGMIRIDAALPPEEGIPFLNRLDHTTAAIRRAAKKRAKATGEPLESWDKHAADALATLSATDTTDRGDPGDGGGGGGGDGDGDISSGGDGSGDDSGGGRRKRSGRRVDLCIVADINALRRGHAHPGEPCHIIGGGTIPVSLIDEQADDAFVKLVLHDGINIHTVKHLGRYRKAELRTALELGPPPRFDGVACAEPGCDRRYGLQWDHLHPIAAGGHTSYDNIGPKCFPHHKDKSERERQAGLYSRDPHDEPPP